MDLIKFVFFQKTESVSFIPDRYSNDKEYYISNNVNSNNILWINSNIRKTLNTSVLTIHGGRHRMRFAPLYYTSNPDL